MFSWILDKPASHQLPLNLQRSADIRLSVCLRLRHVPRTTRDSTDCLSSVDTRVNRLRGDFSFLNTHLSLLKTFFRGRSSYLDDGYGAMSLSRQREQRQSWDGRNQFGQAQSQGDQVPDSNILSLDSNYSPIHRHFESRDQMITRNFIFDFNFEFKLFPIHEHILVHAKSMNLI